MNTPLARNAYWILDTIEAEGYEAFMVGGCVRDHVMNRPIHDIDITTSAPPDVVMSLFPRAVATGLLHGTVTIVTDSGHYEVTTYRRESEYENHRRPAGVEFVSSLTEDLRRRDFTMNAMALGRLGEIIDPFGGQDDIRLERIRCVGDPAERLQEDALRILRGIRFAGTMGFNIEPDTWKALLVHRGLIRHIAMERVRMELERLMKSEEPVRGWRLLLASGLLSMLKRDLPLPVIKWTADHIPEEWDRLGMIDAISARWTCLLLTMNAGSQEAKEALKLLAFSSEDTRRIVRPLEMNDRLSACVAAGNDPIRCFKQAVLALGKQSAEDWLAVMKALPEGSRWQTSFPEGFTEKASDELSRMTTMRFTDLAVDGNKLMTQLELKPGPALGRLLLKLLEDVALDGLPNEGAVLTEKAEHYSKAWNEHE